MEGAEATVEAAEAAPVTETATVPEATTTDAAATAAEPAPAVEAVEAAEPAPAAAPEATATPEATTAAAAEAEATTESAAPPASTVPRKRLVVVGCGIGGATFVELVLQSKQRSWAVDVTVIEPRDFFEVNWASLRATVNPEVGKEATVLLKTLFGDKINHVHGRVQTVHHDRVELTSGDTVPFDMLVLATGSAYKHGFAKASGRDVTLEQRRQEYVQQSATLKAAKNVLIVGGGPVGVEMAGEVISAYPETKVTMVHSRERVLHSLTKESASQYAFQWIVSRGGKVILSDRVKSGTPENATSIETEKGQNLTADLIYWCTGSPVNTEYMRANFASALDDAGLIKVDEYLRVAGALNIFALGDVCTADRLKTGYLAMKHASIVRENVKALCKGPTPVCKYKPAKEAMFVSLGPDDGVGVVMGMRIKGWIVVKTKSKSLLLPRMHNSFQGWKKGALAESQ